MIADIHNYAKKNPWEKGGEILKKTKHSSNIYNFFYGPCLSIKSLQGIPIANQTHFFGEKLGKSPISGPILTQNLSYFTKFQPNNVRIRS